MTCPPPTRHRQPPRYPYDALEPELRDVLADPIVRTLMARDGIGLGDIRYLTALMRRRAPAPVKRRPTWPGADLLRTPLNAILGFAWMIEHEAVGPLGDARYKCYARDIGAAGETLLSLLECMLPTAAPAGSRALPSSPHSPAALGRRAPARDHVAGESLPTQA